MLFLENNGIQNVNKCIENVISDLVSAILDASKNLPVKEAKKHLKPYWNMQLSKLAKDKKDAWKTWVKSGRCRGNNPDFLQFKNLKKIFRFNKKQAEIQYELDKLDEIRKSHQMDQKYFWYLVNKRKKKSGRLHPIKLKCGKIVTDPNVQRNEWKNYFQELYTPKCLDNFDDGFREYVENKLSDMENESYNNEDNILLEEFTYTEVEFACKKLKSGKSPGWDEITSEHVKYGGRKLVECLQRLFNVITTHEYVPLHFKMGIIVAIPIKINYIKIIIVVSLLFLLLLNYMRNVLCIE